MFKIKIAIFPGNFDPINNGQLDIIRNSIKIFDKIIVLVQNDGNRCLFSVENRLNFIRLATSKLPSVEADYWPKFLSEYISISGACAVLRGIKAGMNFEKEISLATTTEMLNKEIKTFFVLPNNRNFFITSKLVHQLFLSKKNLDSVIPKIVEQEIKKEV